jgi:hypothetical protein
MSGLEARRSSSSKNNREVAEPFARFRDVEAISSGLQKHLFGLL